MQEQCEDKQVKVLVVEDNTGDYDLLLEALEDVPGCNIELQHVETIKAATMALHNCSFDLVTLDLSLPDAQGLEAFEAIHHVCPHTPVIVLTGNDDESMAVKAVGMGAQDYLIKGRIEGELLSRSIRYAIERQRMMDELRSMSLIDELTGLYNRRGFLTLVSQQLVAAQRTGTNMLLLFIDLDDMKPINDTHGHDQGDRALTDFAEILNEQMRQSDIVARMGGDEFVILAPDAAHTHAGQLVSRILNAVDRHNADTDLPYGLSISIGVAHYESDEPKTVDELLAEADHHMYEHKRSKKEAG